MISQNTIEALYRPLFSIGALGSTPYSGYLRAGWSAEESAAMSYIQEQAEKIGLQSRYDAIGNLFLEQPGFGEYVECGSHLDTVNRGGNYDGAAGIVTGLAAISSIIGSGQKFKRGLRLRIWRGEEGTTFFATCKGSRAALGQLPSSSLQFKYQNRTLEQAISELGFDPQPIREQQPTISQQEIDGIVAHLELHIEQANYLERKNIDIGAVTSIRGPIRWKIVLTGSFDHSGGTPMGVEFRRDVNLALGYITVALDKLSQRAIADGNDLVQTIGVINSDKQLTSQHEEVWQNALAKVSGFGYFTLDIRSRNAAFRAAYAEQALAEIERIAAEFRVNVSFEKISETTPNENLDTAIRKLIINSANELGYSSTEMPSGAVHDCLYVGERTKSNGAVVPIGMIFIPCRDGISHAPEEFASMEAITKGANVLARVMRELLRG